MTYLSIVGVQGFEAVVLCSSADELRDVCLWATVVHELVRQAPQVGVDRRLELSTPRTGCEDDGV